MKTSEKTSESSECGACTHANRPLCSFEATPDSGRTAHDEQRAVGVEDFISTTRAERITVPSNVDRVPDPLRPRPGAGWVESEGFKHLVVGVSASLFPHAMTGAS